MKYFFSRRELDKEKKVEEEEEDGGNCLVFSPMVFITIICYMSTLQYGLAAWKIYMSNAILMTHHIFPLVSCYLHSSDGFIFGRR